LIHGILDFLIPTGLKISPDGKSIVYSTRLKWNHKKGQYLSPAIWIADVWIQKSARRLTDGSYNDKMPQWSPDGEHVAFVSDRGENGKTSAIYMIELSVGEIHAITPAKYEKPITKFEFSPDGKRILFLRCLETSFEIKAKLEAKDDAVVWGQQWEYSNLHLLDLETGVMERLFEDNIHVEDFTWSADGTQAAVVTHCDPDIESKYLDGASISILQIPGKEIRAVCHLPKGVYCLTWSGSTLFFLANNILDQDTSGLAVYSVDILDEEPFAPSKVAFGEENCPTGLVNLGSGPIASVEHGLQDQLRFLDGKVLISLPKRIIEFDTCLNARNEIVLVVSQGDLNNPTEVFSTTTTGEMLQLSDHGNTFAGEYLGNCAFLQCQTLDNKERLEGLFLTPAQLTGTDGKPTTSLPTIVLFHGGPYSRITDSFDVWDPLHMMIPMFLKRGYGILIPNYRGSSGRGQRFASYGRGRLGIYDEPDIVAMVQYAITQGYADSDNLVAGGWSQGGHLAYLSAVRNGAHGFGWRFKGIIAGAGITDWEALILTSDLGYFQAQIAGASPWRSEKDDLRARSGSALWKFKRAAQENRIPPMLILHGQNDQRTPVTQAKGFVRAMRQAKLPCEFVTYPREGHYFTERKHIEDLMMRVLRFVGDSLS